MEVLGQYINGNVATTIYSDGTKVHETNDYEFLYSFPEAHDIQISQCCDNGCKYCYAGCTPNGKHGRLTGWRFFDSMRPYTEVAINIQFPTPPDLMEFLYTMKAKNIFVNITINQNHFMTDYGKQFVAFLVKMGLIQGIGISVTDILQDGFLEEVRKYSNAVLHVIAGIIHPEDLYALGMRGKGQLKLLILGFKHKGRGNKYYEEHAQEVEDNIQWVESGIEELQDVYKIIAFDNLAVEQLHMKDHVDEETWEVGYAGEDGMVTFYIDLVNGTFARSSMSPKTYPIGDKSIDEMFEIVRQELRGESA